MHDVVLGRSEASLESYLGRLAGKGLVRVVCMDLAASYRALVKKHFPQARIVADRFHVIRTVNHHFLACWKDIDPTGAKNRRLVSLMRRDHHRLTAQQQEHLSVYLGERPAPEAIYYFKQRLCCLLLEKGRNQKRCHKLPGAFCATSPRSVVAGSRHWLSSATPCMPGVGRSPALALHPQ